MTYEIAFTSTAQKQMEKLDKILQERILNSLERIRVRPYEFVKKLQGSPYYRMRAGDYRIIIKIINDKLVILVVEVGHRRNIYK